MCLNMSILFLHPRRTSTAQNPFSGKSLSVLSRNSNKKENVRRKKNKCPLRQKIIMTSWRRNLFLNWSKREEDLPTIGMDSFFRNKSSFIFLQILSTNITTQMKLLYLIQIPIIHRCLWFNYSKNSLFLLRSLRCSFLRWWWRGRNRRWWRMNLQWW